MACTRSAELCDFGGLNCERILDDAGREVPPDPPVIVSMQPEGGGNTPDGQLVELCGIGSDGLGYRSKLHVFRWDGSVTAIEPIYWAGLGAGRGLTKAELGQCVPASGQQAAARQTAVTNWTDTDHDDHRRRRRKPRRQKAILTPSAPSADATPGPIGLEPIPRRRGLDLPRLRPGPELRSS